MNPDEVIATSIGDLSYDVNNAVLTINNGMGTVGINTMAIANGGTGLGLPSSIDEFLDEHIMSRVTVDHKVQEQELMKLRETAPDYANEIKEIIAKKLARDVSKKITYTKKHDKDADVHHFIGRVWVFTEQELKDFIKEAKNVN